MLLFLLVVVVVGGFILMVKRRKSTIAVVAIMGLMFVSISFLGVTIGGMCTAINQVNTYEQQTEVFTEENERIKEMEQLITERLNDDPELVAKLQKGLEEEIKENDKEEKRLLWLEKKVKTYRWLVWPLASKN